MSSVTPMILGCMTQAMILIFCVVLPGAGPPLDAQCKCSVACDDTENLSSAAAADPAVFQVLFSSSLPAVQLASRQLETWDAVKPRLVALRCPQSHTSISVRTPNSFLNVDLCSVYECYAFIADRMRSQSKSFMPPS